MRSGPVCCTPGLFGRAQTTMRFTGFGLSNQIGLQGPSQLKLSPIIRCDIQIEVGGRYQIHLSTPRVVLPSCRPSLDSHVHGLVVWSLSVSVLSISGMLEIDCFEWLLITNLINVC